MKKTEEEKWLERRKQGIGSSNSPILVLGNVFGKRPINVYIDKIISDSETKIDKNNSNFRRGHTYEHLGIHLAEDKLKIKIFSPKDDKERYHDFQSYDADNPWLFADFDGLTECKIDGYDFGAWVVEIKSPLQRVVEKIKNEGVKDYYQIQSMHLARVANNAKDPLPYLGDKYKGKIKGTILVIYEPENVDVLIHIIPYDSVLAELIVDAGKEFWNENVLKRIPPEDGKLFVEKPKVKTKSALYESVTGSEWEDLEKQYLFSSDMVRTAEKRFDNCKKLALESMELIGKKKVQLPKGLKLLRVDLEGKKTFNIDALKAAYPNIDLDLFYRSGEPSFHIRSYGAKDEQFEHESVDGAVCGVVDEFEEICSSNDNDLELEFQLFEQISSKHDLYKSLLVSEMSRMETARIMAAERISKLVK